MRKRSVPALTERSLLSAVFYLAWPAMLEQALQTVVQYVDTAMVGSIGVHATAAVGLTTSVMWLANSPLWAMGIGVLACVARAVGARDTRTIRSTAQQAVFLALIMGVINTAATELIASSLPGWLRADPSLWHDGSLYFAIVCAPSIFRSFSFILGSALRGAGDTRTPMRINLAMNAINIALNYILIYPTHDIQLFGLRCQVPGFGMGVTGAALATAIAVVFSGTAMLISALNSPVLKPRGIPWRVDKPVMGECVRIGLPVMLQNLCVFSGHVVFSSLVTSMGEKELATHTIAITAEQAVYIPGFGMQASASTLCGIAVGERDEEKLDRVSRMVLLISMGLMTLTGAVLFAIPDVMMGLFTSDQQVIKGGAVILRMVACSEPFYAAMIIFEGIFRGVGQTRYSFVVSVITMWGLRIMGTVLCTQVWHLGLPAVWMCMICDNVFRALLLGIRYFRGNWKRSLWMDGAFQQ